MVVIIFGQGLVVWSGYITGILFIASFFGCFCNFKYFKTSKFMSWFRERHVFIMRAAFVFFLIHAGLGILSRYFGINV